MRKKWPILAVLRVAENVSNSVEDSDSKQSSLYLRYHIKPLCSLTERGDLE